MKRPYELLPIPFPKDYDPGPAYFDKIAQQFIPDMIQMMSEGILIDPEAVENLKTVVKTTLSVVEITLASNKLIQEYQASKQPREQQKHADKALQAIRTADYYLKPFNASQMVHRTWVVNTYLKTRGRAKDVKDKWSVKDLKSYNVFFKSPFIDKLINKMVNQTDPIVLSGMKELAEHKAALWNLPRQKKAEQPVAIPPFNPGSNKQLSEFFEYVGVTPVEFSEKTGNASWGRDQIEIVNRTNEDKILAEVLGALIDYSYSAIIQNNFLKAFDTFTVDGVLYGNIKLFGAKSFRNTSNSPNLLNAPSTKSIYAKPLKRCFTSKDGYLIYTADLSALEDRVIANLSGDTNKCNIFLEGLDGHSLNAAGYFTEETERLLNMKYANDSVTFVKAFMEKVYAEDPTFEKIRQKSKGPTFKLAYGGYPDSHKGGVITPDIFNNYHQVLYPGITDYRENYVLRTALKNKYIHLGLGCRIYSDNPSNDIRTLHNATVQFWSILTLIALNELNHRIREEKLEKEIQAHSTIYDSIYTQTLNDADVVKWLNDNMIELMCVQYLENQIIPNDADGEIGPNWADLTKVPKNASVQEIAEILRGIGNV